MKCFAWAVIALGLWGMVPSPAAAQDAGEEPSMGLGRNFPNPFNPETTIPFRLPEDLWEQERPVVGLLIYNVLAQLVAIPVLQSSGQPLDGAEVDWNGTGQFFAYWDGKVLDSNREAASGVYVYQLLVNGRRVGSQKMTIIK